MVMIGKMKSQIFFSELGDELKNAGKSGAGFEGTLASELIDDAVGEGIGEGNAQFNNIGACFCEGGDEARGGGEIGISRDEIGDEGFALLFFETGKEVVDPAGGAHPGKDSARDRRVFTRENRFRRTRISGPCRREDGGEGFQRHRGSRRLQ